MADNKDTKDAKVVIGLVKSIQAQICAAVELLESPFRETFNSIKAEFDAMVAKLPPPETELLEFKPHDIPVLVGRCRLKPPGYPPPNDHNYFATVKLQELRDDSRANQARARLARAQRSGDRRPPRTVVEDEVENE